MAQVTHIVGCVLTHGGQGSAQQSNQTFLHEAGPRRIRFNQVVDGRQGVEQEVGFYLRLHGGHARLYQLALELLGFSQIGGCRGFLFGLNLLLESGLDHDGREDDQERQLRQLDNASGNHEHQRQT